MTEAALVIILFAAAPILFSCIFYLAEKKTGFGKLNEWLKQVIIGAVFGALAIFPARYGVKTGELIVTVRDACALCAGLIFGAPAGIAAGVMSGIECWLLPVARASRYIAVAGAAASVTAGLLGAFVRKYMFDDKKPTWFYGLSIGMTVEVLHMLLLFLTNMSNIAIAFSQVRRYSVIAVALNGITVMLAVLAVSLLGKEKIHHSRETKKIAQTFQYWLLICVVIAFAVTTMFTNNVQERLSQTNSDYLLYLNMQDVRNDISYASDRNLLSIARRVANDISQADTVDSTLMLELTQKYDVTEVNLVDEYGKIVASTHPDYLGYNMWAGRQSAEFLPLLYDQEEYVQAYQPISFNSDTYRKYAGIALEKGFVQVGYGSLKFQENIAEQVESAARNRHIGKNGFVMICDNKWQVVSDPFGRKGEDFSAIGNWITDNKTAEGKRFVADIYGSRSYCAFTKTEGYYIISVLPENEVMLTRDIAVYVTMFMEFIIFVALFAQIYILIKKLVVENIQKVNNSLAQITNGNLDVTVDVRTNEEFACLSDDINSTVVTLKHYIDEAAARIDKELEFAKQIQHSALPSVFPPYPNRKDFDIFADMITAKEVGGDFYDFYLLKKHTLAFLIADVSGKGIPAAMFMMTAKTLIKSLTESEIDVGEVFTQANKKLCEGNDAGMFVTAWMGILNLKDGTLSYANAGHNFPVIRRANGEFEYLKSRANFVLAGMDGVKYRKNEIVLAPGDEIFLYTDGVTEATAASRELFGDDRLLNSLNAHKDMPLESLCRSVKSDVDEFVGDAPQFDDITMLAVKVNHLQKGNTITTQGNRESIEMVNAFVEKQMEIFEMPPKLASKVNIVVDEIYSNIANYSGATESKVECYVESGVLNLIFHDNGKPYNPLEAEDPDITLSAEEREIGGLGIFMVKKLMTGMEYNYENGYNVLTMTLNIQ